MDRLRRRIAGLALGAAAFAALGTALAVRARAAAPGQLFYQTSCAIVEPGVLGGYVTNQSANLYLVSGEVKFVFSVANSISRPEIQVVSRSLIRPGETALVASTQLALELQPGETCRFDVSATIQKE